MIDSRAVERGSQQPKPQPKWGFLTNHAVILVYVVLHSDSTVRDIAAGVGITERATLAILRDLDRDGIVERRRDGRRNIYSVNFARLSSVRRGGVSSPLTPRLFVEVVVKMLYDMAAERGDVPAQPPPDKRVHDDDLEERIGTWGFFTNHLLVLLAIARDRSRTVRDVAATIGITERAVVGIVNQLETEGVLSRTREGRRNIYSIDFDAFRNFRGWAYAAWCIPEPLINVATLGVQQLASQ